MPLLPVFQVDAFTRSPFCGNPAGVVLEADGLTERQMLQIASEINASETAFVMRPGSADADFRIRFFTPACEVPLCGHATVAAFHILCEQGVFPPQTPGAVQETAAGLLPVAFSWDERGARVTMTQATPQFKPFTDDPVPLFSALGLTIADWDRERPIELAFTGLWDLMVPLTGLEAMRRVEPDHPHLARLNRIQGVVSTHVWTTETAEPDNQVHARNLSAAVGIPEDPVTGSSNGALGAYLARHQLLPCDPLGTIRMEQGYEIGRPGVVHVTVLVTEGTVTRVTAGGEAVTVFSGMLRF